ncbi:MAG: prepilin-type N-terminal cleavage/methylation domain-containing protein [Lachnospiraceae bacterium]|nr:prepilin-type N-terminal cleavage/methylation domain-containing protein [Lachnospiraceae bacterium]
MMRISKKKDKGFTLVELIIVIAIMAILVAIITPQFLGYIDKARKTRDLEMARVLGTALDRVLALNPEANEEWESIPKNGPVWFNVKEPGTGKSYKIINGLEWTLTVKGEIQGAYSGNFRNGILRDPYGTGSPGKIKYKKLYEAYVDELAQYDINIFYRKYNTKQYRIVKRADNGRPEVWVCPVKSGTDGEGINNGFVYYRLWPDYDPEYMSNKAPVAINANGRTNTL